MIRVLQINGGVGILGVHMFFVLLHLQPPPVHATPNDLSEEESKSLWHLMAESLLLVNEDDRDRFMDFCLKRHIMCDESRFSGPTPGFQWRAGITQTSKDRFWHTYACTYNLDIKQCPVDGGWSSWSPWNRCSATCDTTGNQTRTRTCTNPVAVRGGEKCLGSMLRSRPCLGFCADNNSTKGGYAEADAFLLQVHSAYPDLMHDCYYAHCTYGVVKRVITEAHVRAKYWSSLSCVKFGGACPVDGVWSGWSPWSQCSLNCGSGSRTRMRTCDAPQPAFGGHPCKGEFHEQQSCIKRDCGPASTETFTEWTKWSPCSVSCGAYGAQSSTRVCLRHAGCDLSGVLTPHVNRSRPCYPGDCPSQGGWSEWTEWTDCSAACGAGRQSRLRLCDSPFPTGGLYCLGDPLDFRLCKGDNCAGQPNPIVNTGFRSRPGEKPEDVLIGKTDEYLNGPLNPSLEAMYTKWSLWSSCSASCGQGYRKRTRWCSPQITPLPPCEGEVQQIQFCNVFVCPVSGAWGVWLPWTPCSTTCGKGKRQRYRECNNPLPQFGGSCDGDAARAEECDMGVCPRIASGTWSKWTAWTTCTVSCGGGERTRERSRQRMGGQPPRSAGYKNNPLLDTGNRETLDCNTQPCPVHGSWAEWGEWSRCSVLCGLGRKTRDRTCTDPSPIFGGEACSGPGTDLAHCFAGPCKDAEDRAIHLGPTSWIRYAPRNRPSRFLTLYIHLKPMAPTGYLLRRYRKCRSVFDDDEDDKDQEVEDEDKKNNNEDRKADEDEKCELIVELRLVNAETVLTVLARRARLDIQSPVALSLGAWHEIVIEVLKSGATLRVNDHDSLTSSFSRQLVRDLDFDSYMTVGASDNQTLGMQGSISTLSVNFRTQDLFASTDWEGQGTPVGRHAVSVQTINPSVQLPHFRGLYYSPLRMYHTERLLVRLTMALDQGEGLLLYARGQGEGTLFTLGLKHTRLVICMVCDRATGNVCHHGDLLRLHQWYHVDLHVENKEVELRVDQGKALQLTCKGLPFQPRNVLFVGGRSAAVWKDVQRATNYTEGFFGVLGTIVVNGRTIPFRQAVLLGRHERINPDGYSRATRITPVFEHKNSIVTLHCEVEKSIDTAVEVKVIWLRGDAVLEPSDHIEIVKPVGLSKRVGSLQLQPGGRTEGIYACVISRDGRLELNHVFPVFRHTTAPDLYEGNVEWLFLKLLLIFLPLIAMCCILYKFRQWFIDLFNKWFGGKKPPEKEPLLTEPLDIHLPVKKHLHGSDPQGSWDNFLAQKTGNVKKISVVTFGPPEPKKLTVTPGVSSERPDVVSEGQLKLGDNPRQNDTNNLASNDPIVQLRRMSYAGQAPFTHLPGDSDIDARRKFQVEDRAPYQEAELYAQGDYANQPAEGEYVNMSQLPAEGDYVNMSQNKRLSREQLLISRANDINVSRQGENDVDTNFPREQRGRPAVRVVRHTAAQLRQPLELRRRSHSGEHGDHVPKQQGSRRFSIPRETREMLNNENVRGLSVPCNMSTIHVENVGKYWDGQNKYRIDANKHQEDLSRYRNNSSKHRGEEPCNSCDCCVDKDRDAHIRYGKGKSKHCDKPGRRYLKDVSKGLRDQGRYRGSKESRNSTEVRQSHSRYRGHRRFSNTNSSALQPGATSISSDGTSHSSPSTPRTRPPSSSSSSDE